MNWEDRVYLFGAWVYDHAVLEWIAAIALPPAAYLLINLSR